MSKTATFYCILLINPKTGQRGYVLPPTDGKVTITDGTHYHVEVLQFMSYQGAQQYIKEGRLEQKGFKAYIRDNHDLMKDDSGAKAIDKPLYYIEDHTGAKLYYDTHSRQYCLKYIDVGYPFWYTREEAQKAIENINFPFELIIKEAHPQNNA